MIAMFYRKNGLYGIQYKCSHGVIATTTWSPTQSISYDKKIPVAVTPCEQPLMIKNYLMMSASFFVNTYI